MFEMCKSFEFLDYKVKRLKQSDIHYSLDTCLLLTHMIFQCYK